MLNDNLLNDLVYKIFNNPEYINLLSNEETEELYVELDKKIEIMEKQSIKQEEKFFKNSRNLSKTEIMDKIKSLREEEQKKFVSFLKTKIDN